MNNKFFSSKLLTLSLATFLLTSCQADRSEKVEALKRSDKSLTCSEILLEMNEADFYKKQAYEKRELGIKTIVMPLGYVGTYMSADEAISAADNRIAYMQKIYELKNCEGRSAGADVERGVNDNISRAMQAQPPVIVQYPQMAPAYGYPQGGGY